MLRNVDDGQRLIGSLGQHYKNLPLSKFFWSWPFAVAYLRGDVLSFSLRGPLRVVMRPIEVRLDQIAAIEVRRGSSSARMRVRLVSPSKYDRVEFGAGRNAHFWDLIAALEARGVTIREG